MAGETVLIWLAVVTSKTNDAPRHADGERRKWGPLAIWSANRHLRALPAPLHNLLW